MTRWLCTDAPAVSLIRERVTIPGTPLEEAAAHLAALADGPTEMRRKGSFLVRMGSSPGPLEKDGEKTRLKLSLEAWGHNGDKASAVARGRRLLEAAKRSKRA